ncbi:MAG: patatin-like phospholipase family protein [Betaproteobacteria bacterium]|nr:MAG: patatin-like phospholipase family protein [Betaproteobacteria bacterium]
MCALAACLALLLSACATTPPEPEIPPEVEPPIVEEPTIALVLGGGAAKGFAHVGVIKALEAHDIAPDMVVGTSAGSVVAALFAAGYNGFELQRISLSMDETTVRDWILPNRGFIRGDALQNFINEAVQNRDIQTLNRKLAVVATDLQTGDPMVFQSGNTGMAVRASSSVPGIFRPVKIGTREFVDGGLVSPVPVKVARNLGADIVIAVNISEVPQQSQVKDTVDILLQTFTIMGHVIASQELAEADVVITPDISELKSTSFDSRNYAIIEGEKAGLTAVPMIKQKIEDFYASRSGAAAVAAEQEEIQ